MGEVIRAAPELRLSGPTMGANASGRRATHRQLSPSESARACARLRGSAFAGAARAVRSEFERVLRCVGSSWRTTGRGRRRESVGVCVWA